MIENVCSVCLFFIFYNACIDLSDSDSVTEPDSLLANVMAYHHAQWQPGWKTMLTENKIRPVLLADL